MINRDEIRRLDFEITEMPEFGDAKDGNGIYRLTQSDRAGMPVGEDIVRLRTRLGVLFHEKLQGDYAKLEVNCDIKRDTFRRVQGSNNKRNATYEFLAKFCLGAKLSVEEAKELFLLRGYTLNEQNRYDYLLLCELKNGGDIVDYNDDLIEFGYKGVISAAD